MGRGWRGPEKRQWEAAGPSHHTLLQSTRCCPPSRTPVASLHSTQRNTMQTSVLRASSVRCAPSLQRTRLSSIKRAPLAIRAAAVTETQTFSTTISNGNGNGASQPITVDVNVPAPTPDLMSPADAYMYAAKAGAKQAEMSVAKTFTMALYAGAYIAFGGFLGLAVVSNCPGIYGPNPGLAKLLFAILFPVGLTMNTLHGTELFTGNTMKLPAAIYEGKSTFGKLCHNWFWSYLGNFVGSLALVWMVVQSGVLAAAPGYAIKTAMAKGTLPWAQAFLRAVMANWLVCVAVWNAGAASSLPGKVLGIWPPISAFVAIGLEHSVANMFLIPLGIALGAELTFGQFITQNLIPVTLGNIVGGLVFMGTASGYFYGSLGKKKEAKTA